jgi:hypothetical protein
MMAVVATATATMRSAATARWCGGYTRTAAAMWCRGYMRTAATMKYGSVHPATAEVRRRRVRDGTRPAAMEVAVKRRSRVRRAAKHGSAAGAATKRLMRSRVLDMSGRFRARRTVEDFRPTRFFASDAAMRASLVSRLDPRRCDGAAAAAMRQASSLAYDPAAEMRRHRCVGVGDAAAMRRIMYPDIAGEDRSAEPETIVYGAIDKDIAASPVKARPSP